MLVCTVLLTVIAVSLVHKANGQELYRIPEPEVEAYNPRGFRISIEDAPGIRLFAFHGNINRELRDLEAGTFSKDILHKYNGRWTFEDRNTKLEVGDVIHYWLFVIKDDLGYRLDGGRFEVRELWNSPIDTSRPRPRPTRPPQPSRPQQPQESGNGQPSEPEPCVPVQSSSQSPAMLDNDREEFLRVCERTVLNATQALLSLQSQMDMLRKTNQQLTSIIERYPDGKKLTLSGRIPPDDEAVMTVRFIMRGKLDLNPDIVSAVRTSQSSITFEVGTLSEKLEIIEVAKDKLKNSKIIIS